MPEYESPPVTEVVCGILFKPLDGLQMPHIGLLWDRFRAEYPTCQEVAPLLPVVERFGDAPEPDMGSFSEVPPPRIWFLHKDGTGIIQVQKDRFLHNWKQANPSDEYPRYAMVKKLFASRLEVFEGFLAEFSLGPLSPFQYEMTYVNHIPLNAGWKTLSDIGNLFPDHRWHDSAGRFLPTPEVLNVRQTFALPDKLGRLHVAIRNAARRDDMQPILLFELTVRGFPNDASAEAMWKWFDLAREWIVRGFTDLTSESAQRDVWRRTR
jgi:uncharacterized protein (TIGR04255 family)